MLKTKKLLTAALAAIIGLSFVACDNLSGKTPNEEPAKQQEEEIKVDFTNYSDFSVKVKNETSKNVVCFMGTPRETNLISGVRATDQAGLKRDPALFSETKDFVLFVVSEDDYKNAKKNNTWEELDNKPLARLYAYYNSDSANNNNIYVISKNLGGIYKLYLNNMTKYNVELRKDGLYGPSIAYSAKQTIKTTIGVEPDDYELFPVFRKLDKTSGEIISSYPKTKKGNPQFFSFSLDDATTEYEIDAKDFVGDGFKITPNQAQLKINNQSKSGVSLYQGTGSTAILTSTGGKIVNSGKALTFSVDMDTLGNGVYESQRTISAWKYGSSAYKFPIPSHTFIAGKRYVLNVTGDEYDDLTATFETDEEGAILAYDINYDED